MSVANWLIDSLKKESEKLYERYCSLKDKITTEMLQFVQLPNFTDHGIKHTISIQDNLARIIPKEIANPLSPFELFTLFSASLLHDCGMATTESANEETGSIRVDHYNRSKRFILTKRDALGLSEHEAEIIGEISRAHGMPDLSYLDRREYSIKGHGAVRVQLLSALLRLADILDICYDRAPLLLKESRHMPEESKKHWDIHRCITDVRIVSSPSWDIVIFANSDSSDKDRDLYDLRNSIQIELDTIFPILRRDGILFKKVELRINQLYGEEKKQEFKNPFILLKHFGAQTASRFAGRDNEIHQMIQKITGQKIVILIGESGVGKTSLVEGGILPRLRKYDYDIIKFSFDKDPVEDMIKQLAPPNEEQKSATTQISNSPFLLNVIRERLSGKPKKRILLIGDHLEQMFTIKKDDSVRQKFVQQITYILGNPNPITFLFCIREDYLPDLYNLSQDIPEFYNRENTFKLHRLDKANGYEVLNRASSLAKNKLHKHLIDRIVDDLCNEGDGVIFPPYLQIVGYRMYDNFAKVKTNSNVSMVSKDIYENLGGVANIVNKYLESLLDTFTIDDKPVVAEILNSMVTDYYTKKRVRLDELQRQLPECHHLKDLLNRLIQHRIIRRTLGEFELIHDFLAARIVKIVKENTFLSPPVRKALEFIENNYSNLNLTSSDIANAAQVTPTHLASLFNKQIGKTINHSLNHVRISKAKMYLASSLDPVSAISKKTGFLSQHSFSRKFRELAGQSPLKYRKEVMALRDIDSTNYIYTSKESKLRKSKI